MRMPTPMGSLECNLLSMDEDTKFCCSVAQQLYVHLLSPPINVSIIIQIICKVIPVAVPIVIVIPVIPVIIIDVPVGWVVIIPVWIYKFYKINSLCSFTDCYYRLVFIGKLLRLKFKIKLTISIIVVIVNPVPAVVPVIPVIIRVLVQDVTKI